MKQREERNWPWGWKPSACGHNVLAKGEASHGVQNRERKGNETSSSPSPGRPRPCSALEDESACTLHFFSSRSWWGWGWVSRMVPQCGRGQGHWTLGSVPPRARENEFHILSHQLHFPSPPAPHRPRQSPSGFCFPLPSPRQSTVRPSPHPTGPASPSQSTGHGPKPHRATWFTRSVERLMQLWVRSHFCWWGNHSNPAGVRGQFIRAIGTHPEKGHCPEPSGFPEWPSHTAAGAREQDRAPSARLPPAEMQQVWGCEEGCSCPWANSPSASCPQPWACVPSYEGSSQRLPLSGRWHPDPPHSIVLASRSWQGITWCLVIANTLGSFRLFFIIWVVRAQGGSPPSNRSHSRQMLETLALPESNTSPHHINRPMKGRHSFFF